MNHVGGQSWIQRTCAHCYLLSTVPVGRSSWVTRTNLGFWEQSLLCVQTLTAWTNPTLDLIKCSLLVYYMRWLEALDSHLRLRQWQENSILCSINLLEPWAHPFWLICWVLSSSYNRHRSWFSNLHSLGSLCKEVHPMIWRRKVLCRAQPISTHKRVCSKHSMVKLQEE